MEKTRKDLKKVYYGTYSQHVYLMVSHGQHMEDIWTLEQGRLVLA